MSSWHYKVTGTGDIAESHKRRLQRLCAGPREDMATVGAREDSETFLDVGMTLEDTTVM